MNIVIEQGEVLGILGPNGSGKTTFLSLILQAILPTSGHFRWFGQEPSASHLTQVGALLETPNFFPSLSAVENLKIIAHIRGLTQPNISEVLSRVGLLHRQQDKFHTFSLGMKQRLAIASVILGDPEVMIFDEPTNGLDPSGIVDIRNLMIELAQSGKTIIMASHILDEVQKICSHIAILNQGKLLAKGRMEDIWHRNPILELASENISSLTIWVKDLPHYVSHEQVDQKLRVVFEQKISPAEINQRAFEAGIILHHFQWLEPKLEEDFIQWIKQSNTL